MKISKQFSKKVLVLFFLFAFWTSVASAQQNPFKNQDRSPSKNCEVFYKWFTIGVKKDVNKVKTEQGDLRDPNAVENLPFFCTAQSLILWVTERLLYLAGGIAVIFIIIGGFRYLTSAGNEEAAEKGKKTLVTSIIGLVIIILSTTIVRIVANTLNTGTSARNNQPTNQQPPPN